MIFLFFQQLFPAICLFFRLLLQFVEQIAAATVYHRSKKKEKKYIVGKINPLLFSTRACEREPVMVVFVHSCSVETRDIANIWDVSFA